MATFADRIKRLRENKSWTQKQMAEKLGISTSTLRNYETGKTVPKRDAIERFAESLNRNPDWLAGVPGAAKKRVRPETAVDVSPAPDRPVDADTDIVVPPSSDCSPDSDDPFHLFEPVSVSEIPPEPPSDSGPDDLPEQATECEPPAPPSGLTSPDFELPAPGESVSVPEPPALLSVQDPPDKLSYFRISLAAILVVLAVSMQIFSVTRIVSLTGDRSRLQDKNAALSDEISGYESQIGDLRTQISSLSAQVANFDTELKAQRDASYDSGYAAGQEVGYKTGYDEGYESGYDEGDAAGYANGKSEAEADAASATQEQLDEQYAAGYSAGYTAGDSDGYGRAIDYITSEASSSSSSSETGSWDNTSGNYTASATGYPLSTTVYVSNGGKIHLHSNCSGMKNYKTMTLGEAEAKGYELCKNCF